MAGYRTDFYTVMLLMQALRLEFSRFCAEDFTPQLMRKHRLNDIFQQIQVCPRFD